LEGSLIRDSDDINEWIHHWLWRWSISLHWGPTGLHEVGGVHSTGTVIFGELWKQSISLCWHSVMGTWRGGSFTRDPEGYEQEGTGDRHLFP